ncbi:MAG: LUD domain-containing protein [Halanaeroarchaeum sp.]
MATDRIETFESALVGTADLHRTTSTEFRETIAETIDRPAVGLPLPFEDVSLADLPVDINPTTDAIESAATGVTPASLGIADYGTVTLDLSDDLGDLVSLLPRKHVSVLAASDLEPDMGAALRRLDSTIAENRSSHVLETGPSSTADLGTMVRGVHGPAEKAIVLLEDR